MECGEYSVQAEGGGRNVAWGVAVRWGLDADDCTFDPMTRLNAVINILDHVASHTMPNLGTAFL